MTASPTFSPNCSPHARLLASNGNAAGACCYCGTELIDARSVEAGYGPTCAKKWRLPWGTREPAPQPHPAEAISKLRRVMSNLPAQGRSPAGA